MLLFVGSLTALTVTMIVYYFHSERRRPNRPFYSCVLIDLALIGSEAGGDLVVIQTSPLFICKCKLVSIRTAQSTYEKR